MEKSSYVLFAVMFTKAMLLPRSALFAALLPRSLLSRLAK